MDEIIVFITASKEDEAINISKELVEERLAGCINIIKNIRSIYRWEDKIEDESEVLMIAKTKKNLFEELTKKVKKIHSYSVPEIIGIPIIVGAEDYLTWLSNVTR